MHEKSHQILAKLEKEYPDIKCGLVHKNPFQLLIAVLLSAQTTDKNVNRITKKLFEKVSNPTDILKFSQKELEMSIYSAGFYKQKAKSLISLSKVLVEKFSGKVPDNMKDLCSLRGIARKSANIILSVGFNITEGIAVDTHVKRVSNRLGLSKEGNPNRIEKDLCSTFDKKDWHKINHLFINHGRKICNAQNPLCNTCKLHNLCEKNILLFRNKK